MRQDSSNPKRNSVPSSIREPALVDAIKASGYPLQGIVAGKLNQQFSVTEEWGYIDRDSQEHRSLDVFAYKRLLEDRESSVQPRLALLVECKRSVHPYVFFQNVTDRPISQFPRITGIPGPVSIQDRERSTKVSASRALGLDELAFVQQGPPKCAAFSKAELSGNKARLSGSDPYSSLMLPLVKALEHASELYRPRQPRPKYLFPTLLICMSVLDAPMILVESPEKASDPVLTPWVRIVRQEANPVPSGWAAFRFYAVDTVHIDFLNEVVYEHLLPFAEEFRKRAIQLSNVLLYGGEVPNLDDWKWDQVRQIETNTVATQRR